MDVGMLDLLAGSQAMAALNGIFPLLVMVIGIMLAWWCLQEFRLDLFLRRPRSAQAIWFRIVLAVVLGHQFSRFFIDYFNWALTWTAGWKAM
jgi:uncharacterized membrane protein YwzB